MNHQEFRGSNLVPEYSHNSPEWFMKKITLILLVSSSWLSHNSSFLWQKGVNNYDRKIEKLISPTYDRGTMKWRLDAESNIPLKHCPWTAGSLLNKVWCCFLRMITSNDFSPWSKRNNDASTRTLYSKTRAPLKKNQPNNQGWDEERVVDTLRPYIASLKEMDTIIPDTVIPSNLISTLQETKKILRTGNPVRPVCCRNSTISNGSMRYKGLYLMATKSCTRAWNFKIYKQHER